MEKKEIIIDKGIINRIFVGCFLSFITIFVVEHFSSFSFIADTSNLPNYTPDGKIILNQNYTPTKTKVSVLTQTTPFGTDINIPPNGMMCSELVFAGTEFKSYTNKIQLYFIAVFKDYKYFLIFWGLYTLILLFCRKYQLKITK